MFLYQFLFQVVETTPVLTGIPDFQEVNHDVRPEENGRDDVPLEKDGGYDVQPEDVRHDVPPEKSQYN